MGSPLGPTFADIFMGHLEEKVSAKLNHTTLYKRYVDDVFAIVDHLNEAEELLSTMNNLHPKIKFTMELERDNQISFLDVHLSRQTDGSITRRVFHKNTWKGQYLHFLSFVPVQWKRNLVCNLFQRTRKICSEDTVDAELASLKNTLLRLGYPPRFIDKYNKPLRTKMTELLAPKKPVFISLPFKGDNILHTIKRRLLSAIQRTYYAAELIICSPTKPLPVPCAKDALPLHATSNCVYEFTCTCGCKYIGRTQRQLAARAKEHLPSWLFKQENRTPRSSITEHLLDAGHSVDPIASFRVLVRARTNRILRYLEAAAIRRFKPDLCKQLEHVVNLALPW